ncbi:MAG TPA: SDR family NAD(P)-dependent oxidoreductase [Gemmatimonadaceae bacterium]|nr:SDR family NAD(P)-dependent oxidoreductase [Gemmatimonadaceae bacterium]
MQPVQDTTDRPLRGRVAVVTGASRGAGRGIALELGAAGATVYVTGRSVRGERTPGYDRFLANVGLAEIPGTIDDTAEEVTRLGGVGIPVRCDHTQEAEVEALFARVAREQGALDLLVNNATGHHQDPITAAPFWEQPMSHWEGMFDRGVRNHILASRHAAPLFLRQRRGLIVTTSFWDHGKYTGSFFYDLAKATLNRLAFGLAEELRPHGVASLAVSPGWMRTELVLASFATDEAHWRDVPALAGTESPRYVGRAVVALARDPEVLARSGGVYRVGDLAREYGFTDVDGRRVPPFEIPAG